MADITKCTSTACPIKDECYRYTAPAAIVQPWADFYDANDKDCLDYISIKWEPKGAK